VTPSPLIFQIDGVTPQPAGSKKAFIPKSNEVKLQVAGGGTGAVNALNSLRAVVVDANSKATPWKNHVAHVAKERMEARGLPLATGALRMEIRIFVPRPQGHWTSKGELSAEGRRKPFPISRPDLTKLVRGIEDAMTGIVYKDDAQIISQYVSKFWAEDGNSRVYVSVTPARNDNPTQEVQQ
jgi:Holliday junction resolvase RusA-like endonuclease